MLPLQTNPAATQQKYKGLSANMLKFIAIAAMLIDHSAAVFMDFSQPQTIFLRAVGRTTAPIMFFFLVEGYHRTSNINKYTLRMLLFAAVSYVPFIYCMEGSLPNEYNFMRLNVIFTLFLALLVLRARHEIKNQFLQWAVICVLIFLSLTADWSYIAIIYILFFDYFYRDYKKQAFAYCMVSLFYIAPYFLSVLQNLAYNRTVNWAYVQMLMVYAGLFIPIFLLRFYNGEKGKGGKVFSWFFYIFYPVHLLILGWIKYGVVW